MPGALFAGGGKLAWAALADVGRIDERPVAAAQVAHLNSWRVDLEQAVVARHFHEFQRGGELNVAVARAANDTPSRLGELALLALERAVGERQGDFHSHLRGSFSGTGEQFPGHGGCRTSVGETRQEPYQSSRWPSTAAQLADSARRTSRKREPPCLPASANRLAR